jgi:protein-histidine N-methyltransferase
LLTTHVDASPASLAAREATQSDPVDPSAPGEVHIADELRDAFLSSLAQRNITIRFFSGAWETFDLQKTGGNYDLLMTSETIYRTESLVPLTRILDEGCPDSLTEKAAKLSVNDKSAAKEHETSPLCLVAAKVLYFGVGGGISEFVEFLSEKKPGRKGEATAVLEKVTNVGRRVLSIQWI